MCIPSQVCRLDGTSVSVWGSVVVVTQGSEGWNMNGRNVSGNKGSRMDGCTGSTGGWWSQAMDWRLMRSRRQPRSLPPILQADWLFPPPAEQWRLGETMPALSAISPWPPHHWVTNRPCIACSWHHSTSQLTLSFRTHTQKGTEFFCDAPTLDPSSRYNISKICLASSEDVPFVCP